MKQRHIAVEDEDDYRPVSSDYLSGAWVLLFLVFALLVLLVLIFGPPPDPSGYGRRGY